MHKFKSGFAWIKINEYSYICKIEEENNEVYTVSLDNHIIYEVPKNELIAIYGDEDWKEINNLNKNEYNEKLNNLYELGRKDVINEILKRYEYIKNTNGTNSDFGYLVIEYLKGELII